MGDLKDYINFIKRILRDSYLLLTKYFLIGIFWIIITFLANEFSLNDLTYFNAMFSLMVFASIIPFGISQGISVYINHNIDDQNEIKKNIKLGFVLTLISIVIFIVIILLFKTLIFKYLIVVNITDNYKFFYLMLPAIALIMICDYFSAIFKILLENKSNLLFCLADFGLTLAAILITSLFQELTLYKIAWCYILTKGLYIPYFLVFAFKYFNLNSAFNLLELTKLKVNAPPKKVKKIISFGVSEIIWNIYFLLSALILLKDSALLYNAYNYFTHTLDMFFGIYYSMMAIAFISISTKLGKRDFDSAYKEGKYTLILSVLIWLFIFMIVLIFKPLFLSGMNPEIILVGQNILMPFMIITLLRFVDWALSCYIMSASGNINRFIWLNIFNLMFYVILFISIDYIKISSINLIYLIGFDSVIGIILNSCYFKSKKWLVKIDE